MRITICVVAVLELDEIGVVKGDELRREDDEISCKISSYLCEEKGTRERPSM